MDKPATRSRRRVENGPPPTPAAPAAKKTVGSASFRYPTAEEVWDQTQWPQRKQQPASESQNLARLRERRAARKTTAPLPKSVNGTKAGALKPAAAKCGRVVARRGSSGFLPVAGHQRPGRIDPFGRKPRLAAVAALHLGGIHSREGPHGKPHSQAGGRGRKTCDARAEDHLKLFAMPQPLAQPPGRLQPAHQPEQAGHEQHALAGKRQRRSQKNFQPLLVQSMGIQEGRSNCPMRK